MRVDLAYGDHGLSVELPTSSTVVIEPRRRPAVHDPHATLVEALTRPVAGPPLRRLVQKGQSVAISVCDGTRPQPRALVVGAILEQLEGIVDLSDVVVVVAGVIDKFSCWAALATGCCDESVAVTVTVELKGASGVPLMTPVVASSDSEVGSPTAVQVYGAVPPAACRVAE